MEKSTVNNGLKAQMNIRFGMTESWQCPRCLTTHHSLPLSKPDVCDCRLFSYHILGDMKPGEWTEIWSSLDPDQLCEGIVIELYDDTVLFRNNFKKKVLIKIDTDIKAFEIKAETIGDCFRLKTAGATWKADT